MLSYFSTRDDQTKISSAEAIVNGLAPDGGLYVPDDLSALALDYCDVIRRDYRGMAKVVFDKFFPDFGADNIDRIVERSYENKFSAPEITPVSKVGDGFVLELYHGPTCAFKDVALSALPNLMTFASRQIGFEDEILILTATSGDTGSAALCGFSNVPGTKIIVFFPHGGVSDTQRLQMVTQPAPNTGVCAVRGNFDDAQTGVKRLFREIPHPREGVSLSSANSINIGRLVPQVVYYFAAYTSLVEAGEIAEGDRVNYVVPTGNFGDIMAGYFAKVMGLPVGKLICASNRNDVLTEFLSTGHYDKRREFYKTTSPSMDILVSSNLERLLYFVCGSEHTKKYMKALSTAGEYTITADELARIQADFAWYSCDDARGAAAIGDAFHKYGYLMDTHTSIAWGAFEDLKAAGAPEAEGACVVLSTASPYKFTKAVLEALGADVPAGDKEQMDQLAAVTGVPVPASLADIFTKEVKHKSVIDVDEMKDFVVSRA